VQAKLRPTGDLWFGGVTSLLRSEPPMGGLEKSSHERSWMKFARQNHFDDMINSANLGADR
jgi:hypothetical protein